jgi:SAM-dependent methyltransferase
VATIDRVSLAGAARSRVTRSRWGIVSWEALADVKAGLRNGLGRYQAIGGATHHELQLEQSFDYVDRVFADYVEYGALGPHDLEDARVLEVGPGDSPAVAVRFLAAGAKSVVGLDRFRTRRDPEQQRAILGAIVGALPVAERARLEGIVDDGGTLDRHSTRLGFVEGVAIEDAADWFLPRSFDIIVSRAVLEHVNDPVRSLEVMDTLLAPGGVQVHKIDLRDHGVFTGRGLHPLTFLTVPEFAFHLTRRYRGGINRARRNVYAGTLRRLGYDSRMWVTHVIGRADELVPHREQLETSDAASAQPIVDAVRRRLTRRFRALPDADLIVDGIFVVARKPDRLS